MPRVADLTDLYGNFMLGPRPGPGVCQSCLDLTDGRRRCLRCERAPEWLDAVAPVSYSIAHEQLHHALAGYKRPPGVVARRFEVELAAVIWRFLALHERCIARAAGTEAFGLATTVPSSTLERDRTHPLHRIVGELAEPTRSRYERVLRRSTAAVKPRTYSTLKFESVPRSYGRGGAPDRRHLDHRRKRSQRRGDAETGRRGHRRGGRDRPSPSPRLSGQRPTVASASVTF